MRPKRGVIRVVVDVILRRQYRGGGRERGAGGSYR